MDKRSFFFVFLMTISFFFLNKYLFDRGDNKTEVTHKSAQEQFENRVVTTNSLPLAPIYHDKRETQFLTNALEFNGVFVTLMTKELPSEIYTNRKPYQLTEINGVAFYRSSSDVQIPSVIIPRGEVELQLISNLASETTTMIGELESSKLHFPYKTIENDAIALLGNGDEFIPVGHWSYEDKKLTLFEDMSEMKGLIAAKPTFGSGSSAKEEFFVLENEYQQVVFSNKGGAIAEINMAFESKDDNKSIVLPINFDRQIKEQSPQNVHFPLSPYTIAGKSGLQQPEQGGYTPLIRRDLMSNSGQISFDMPSRNYALNLVNEHPDADVATYKMVRQTENEIEFLSNEANRRVRKTFKFVEHAPYTLEVSISVDGDAKGLWLTSGIPEVEMVSGSYIPLLQYYADTGKKMKVQKLKLPKETSNFPGTRSAWTSNSNGFFGVIIDPKGNLTSGLITRQISGDAAPSRLTLIDPEYHPYPAKDYPGYELLVPYQPTNGPLEFNVYAGPYEDDIIKSVDRVLTNPASGGNPQFTAAISYQGWLSFVAEPFAKFLYLVMNFFHYLTHSWGLSIILLTVVLRVLLYPLNAWAFKSNGKLAKIGPQLKVIQDKHKKDPKRMQMETAMLYKNEGVNPFSSCLPLLIQFPFLIGMFDVLKTTFELRGASFIPGWINNLTAPDVLFTWKYPIIFFGTSFHLLPFVIAGLMFIQTKMNNVMQARKGPMTDQQKQMASMGNIMALVFLFAFYNMPSGLNIYWTFSTLLGMLQQWLINSNLENASAKPKVLKK